jgi:hypoxanthine phosphoribosyltransferase
LDDYNKIYNEADRLYDHIEVDLAISNIADAVNVKLLNENPIVVCVMNGGLIFSGQIMPKLNILMCVDYVHATRYGNNISGKELVWLREPSVDPAGRPVLILDDILDEGYTLSAIVDKYRNMGASSVFTAVLVTKKDTQKTDLKVDFEGLSVPDRYVFGFGMDYKGYFRNLPGIYAVKD